MPGISICSVDGGGALTPFNSPSSSFQLDAEGTISRILPIGLFQDGDGVQAVTIL